MPLVFNGTTIPTNVANVLKFNGNNVTTVVFNGTTVWQQQLCTVCNGWSGNSYAQPLNTGMTVSGMSFQALLGSSSPGSWISYDDASSSFTSATSKAGSTSQSFVSSYGFFLIQASGLTLRIGRLSYPLNQYYWSSYAVTFNPSTKVWSGNPVNSIQGYVYATNSYTNFSTSGTNLSVVSLYKYGVNNEYITYQGAWISLT